MPHVIVKLWPGKTDRQKSQLAGQITDSVKEVLGYGAESVSVAFQEVSANRWREEVYLPDNPATGWIETCRCRIVDVDPTANCH